RMNPSLESLKATSTVVCDAVAGAQYWKAGRVLKSLTALRSDFRLDPTSTMRLLYGHWQRDRDYDKTQAIFKGLVAEEAAMQIENVQPLYRVMIQISLEAGQGLEAKSYFDRVKASDATAETDIRILALFALEQAKAGNWERVRRLWGRMATRDGRPSSASGEEFVPILKEYARHHTVNETKEFLESYVEGLDVPICPYMVTRMASEFASIRDVASFASWLEYCANAGCNIDATFSNAILTNCWRRWNMPFHDLRRIYNVLHALHPDFVDSTAKHIMAQAALSDPKCRGRAAASRLARLGVDAKSVSRRPELPGEERTYWSMKEDLARGKPHAALRVYKRA
ncbi:MAG: hypothetical protein OK454_12085, partial [Thaumarchaeota archaeon]|nr:hypothetical protein [Nitrososphaerota archaeon]